MKPLSLNLMPTLALSEPPMLSYILFYCPRSSFFPTRWCIRHQLPLASRSSSKAPRLATKGQQIKDHFPKATLGGRDSDFTKSYFIKDSSVAVAAVSGLR